MAQTRTEPARAWFSWNRYNRNGPKTEPLLTLNEALLQAPNSNSSALPRAPPPPMAVLFCPVSGQFHYMKWWLTKFCADCLDIFYMYSEMGHNEGTEMQLKFQDSPNPSVFVTTPKVSGTGCNLTAANHAVITQ